MKNALYKRISVKKSKEKADSVPMFSTDDVPQSNEEFVLIFLYTPSIENARMCSSIYR